MSASIHATAVVLGEQGVLIRGASGAGKSLLALALLDRAGREGYFAALVADDRTWTEAASGRLLARGAAALGGVCERRGEGLVRAPHEAAAVIRLVVDLVHRGVAPSRMPAPADKYAILCGVEVPRISLDLSPGVENGVAAVLSALARIEGSSWRKNVLDETVFT